jgi:hypothetical protein
VPFPYSGTAFLSAALGGLGGVVGNAILHGKAETELPSSIRDRTSDPARLLAIIRDVAQENDHVEGTILTCWSEHQPIMVSTKQRKVYVGVPQHGPEAHDRRRELAIWPLVSGYRDSDSQQVTFTTQYANVYEDLGDDSNSPIDPSDFTTVIPLDEIATLAVFDFDAYESFQASADEMGDKAMVATGKTWRTNFTNSTD